MNVFADISRMRSCAIHLFAATLLLCMPENATAQQVVLKASAFSAGSGVSTGEGYRLHGTIGQAAVGSAGNAEYTVGSGFWYPVTAAEVVINQPPSAPYILTPEDGAELFIGGSSAEPPADPEAPFTVAWTASADPEGLPVTYSWQLSPSRDFEALLTHEDVDTATTYSTTHGAIAALLDDAGVEPAGTIELWHRAVALDGELVTEGPASEVTLIRGSFVSTEASETPERFELHQNYPNPFNPSTVITFDLPTEAEVRLVVFDLFGREVATVIDGRKAAGRYEVSFGGEDLASGVYFYRIEAGTFRATRRMLLVK